MKKNIFAILTVLFALASCDSMEDTYKEFAGDGPIRYAGKCKDIKVVSGWQCLRASWTPSDDPSVKNIIVRCINGNDTIVQTLPTTATETVITDLENVNYQVMVQSLASDGALSLCDAITERPYTSEHETVRAFTRGINKAYLAADHLILFMGAWDSGIDDFNIEYTDKAGQAQTYQLTQSVFNQKYVDVADVDTSKPIVLQRKGWIEGCPDLITFDPYTITRNVSMYSDFRSNIQQRYGVDVNSLDEFSQTVTSVELDNDLYSFEDLFYFTNLSTVVLGKNHYYDGTHFTRPSVEESSLALWVLKTLNSIYDTTVEIYNDTYLSTSASAAYITRKGNSYLPELTYLPTTGWTISNSETDENNDYLNNLLDNNASTTWSSWPSSTGVRTMELTIDMGQQNTVHGVKLVQSATTDANNFQQSTVKVEYYADGAWKNLTHVEENTIGKAQGESTLLEAAEAVETSQVRVTIKEVSYKTQVKVSLADIAIY